MKFKLTFLLFLAIGSQAIAQESTKIKQTAQLMAAATINGDFNTLVKYTYPKVVAAMGGKEKMIAAIEKGLKEMKEQGASFKNVKIGEPGKIVKAGTELHCLVPQDLIMNVKGGYLTLNSTLLAVSNDQGKTWTFISAGKLTAEKIKHIFPDFNNSLIIPADGKPVFHAE